MYDAEHSWKRTLLIGLAIVVAPVIGLNALLAFNTITTAQREIDGVAAAALAVAEQRVDSAVTRIILLGLKGVKSCGGGDAAELAAAERAVRFVAEIAVTDAAGAATCSAYGAPRVVRAASPEHGTASPDVTLSSVGIGSELPERMLRLQWRYPDGSGLRMLIQSEDLFPNFLRSRMTSGFIAEAELMDGGVVSRKLTSPGLADRDSLPALAIHASAPSRRYPLKVDVKAPGAALLSANVTPFVYANVGGLAFALVLALIALLLGRRSGGPIRELADGIRRGEFVPYYQPVIDITSGRIVGCEVLARWIKRDGVVSPPGRFISLAEASGQIFPMTLALMERARDDMAEVYSQRPSLKINFNLCAGHFDDLSLVDDVRRIFGSSNIRPGQLVFEVTERQPLPNVARARLVIAKLQAFGARVALDDVGTGHGGLSYLLKLGVDVMKMDKMFVDAIGTDRYSVAIVDSLVRLADDMNLELVAEGVETIEQVEYLRGKGVRMAQGYVFAPPLPAKSFRALVEAMAPVSRRDRRALPDVDAAQPGASTGRA